MTLIEAKTKYALTNLCFYQALARAAYARASMIVLDDPLSAVDAPTATFILQRLFGENGILRSPNTTVIMTTSSRKCSIP